MAQIKILNLCDSYSLDELGCEDINKVNGGAAGAYWTGLYSIYRRRNVETTLSNMANGAQVGAAFGGVSGLVLGAFAGVPMPGLAAGGAIGASLST